MRKTTKKAAINNLLIKRKLLRIKMDTFNKKHKLLSVHAITLASKYTVQPSKKDLAIHSRRIRINQRHNVKLDILLNYNKP